MKEAPQDDFRSRPEAPENRCPLPEGMERPGPKLPPPFLGETIWVGSQHQARRCVHGGLLSPTSLQPAHGP